MEGLNDNIKGIADRFAAEGFVALAPDMYHGKLTSEPDEAGKLLMALNIQGAENDLKGAVAYL
ncbi:MAG TPA: dienelactone hydrolase family protein, partial [Tepidiformaceae bacterium]|nr:dienelactone hydrolase family protein [Tepidiformaceae bacterium]